VGTSGGYGRPGYVPAEPSLSRWSSSEPPIIERSSYGGDEENDPDLRAAIEASLQEANAPKPSAPTPRPEDQSYSYTYTRESSTPTPSQPPLPKLPNYELGPLESDAILTFNQTVEQLQAQGGRDISRYPGVNELHDKASGLRPKLALCLDDAGRKERESTLHLACSLSNLNS
jgi:hepatocyte growth factor-regulated tyrosine kinase substrate